MGLLDNFNFDDPKTQGLLSAAANLLSASSNPYKPTDFGQGIAGFQQGYSNALKAQQVAQELDYQNQLRKAQSEKYAADALKIQMAEERKKKLSDYMQGFNPSTPEIKPVAVEGLDTSKLSPEMISYLQKTDSEAFSRGVQNFGTTAAEKMNQLENPVGVSPYQETIQMADFLRKGGFNEEAFDLRKDAARLAPRPFGNSFLAKTPYGDMERQLYSDGTVRYAPTTRAITPYQQATIDQKQANAESAQERFLAKLEADRVRREQEAAAKAAAASTPKAMTEDQRKKFEARFAQDYAELNDVYKTLVDIKESASQVKNSEGIKEATGVNAYLPSAPKTFITSGNAKKAETRIAALEGKVTALGKAAASEGGAIGAIANQEWGIMRDMISKLDPKSDDYLRQVGEVELFSERAAERIKAKYEAQHSENFERYPQFKTPEIPKARTFISRSAARKTAFEQGINPNDFIKHLQSKNITVLD